MFGACISYLFIYLFVISDFLLDISLRYFSEMKDTIVLDYLLYTQAVSAIGPDFNIKQELSILSSRVPPANEETCTSLVGNI